MTRAALAAILVFGAACRAAPPPDRRVLVTTFSSSPTTLDPGIALDDASQRIDQLVFSSLLKFDDHLRIVPDLTTRFETTDHQTYVAAVPAGVRFQDGRELTADDIAYTFRRFLDPAFVSGLKGAYRDLVAVDVVDRYTVRFRLRAPSASFPANLTNIGIVPAGSAASLARHPIGSGPYRLVEFVPDDHVTLAAFDGYYEGRPANDGILFRVVPDETMRGLELRRGDIDFVVNDLSPDVFHALEHNPDIALTTAPGTDFAYIGMNLRDPALRDVRVRRAIGYAIDPAAIVQYLRRDQAHVASGIIPPMSWAYAPDLFRFTYDPERAKALLDEAGYPVPPGSPGSPRLHLSFKTSTSEIYRQQAAVLQQELAEVGIALDIHSYEFATFMSDVVRGNVQLYTLLFTGGATADPDILRRVFASTQVPPDGLNRGHYANPEVDQLLDEASAAMTDEDRRRYYVAAQRIIAADAPIISLWVRDNVVAARRDITGVSLTPIADFGFFRNLGRKP